MYPDAKQEETGVSIMATYGATGEEALYFMQAAYTSRSAPLWACFTFVCSRAARHGEAIVDL